MFLGCPSVCEFTLASMRGWVHPSVLRWKHSLISLPTTSTFDKSRNVLCLLSSAGIEWPFSGRV